jgi:hypothetical protein
MRYLRLIFFIVLCFRVSHFKLIYLYFSSKLLKQQDVGYKVESEREKEPSKQTYWFVVKFEWKSDELEAE